MVGDLTVGKPLKLILRFAIPLLIGNIFQQFYSMADTLIVGRTVGVQALAAVGATGSVTYLIMGIIQGLTSGFSVLTAQRFGAKDIDGVRRSVGISISLCIIGAVIITPVSILVSKPILQLMQTPAEIIEDAASYTVIVFAGTVALMFYNMFSSVIRAFGDSKTPLFFLILASIINIGLDFLFILVFQMGVNGAALATVIAQGVSAVACYFYMRFKYKEYMPKKSDYKLALRIIVQHIKVGLPMAFQYIVIAVGLMAVQAAVNQLGTVYVAAFTAASKVDQLGTQTLVSIGTAMATFAAQNYGAGKFKRIQQGVLWGLVVNLSFAILGMLIMIFLGAPISKLFIEDPDPNLVGKVLQYAQVYLTTVSVFYVLLGLLFVYRSSIQGIGNWIIPFLACVIELAMRIIAAFVLTAAIGFVGACLAAPIAWAGADCILIPAYYVIVHKLIKKHGDHSDENGKNAETPMEDNAAAGAASDDSVI